MKKIIITSVVVFLASGTANAQYLVESQLFSDGVPEKKYGNLEYLTRSALWNGRKRPMRHSRQPFRHTSGL